MNIYRKIFNCLIFINIYRKRNIEIPSAFFFNNIPALIV